MINFADEIPDKVIREKKYGEQTSLFQEETLNRSDKNGAELVRAGRDIVYKYGLSNENPDKVIAQKGIAYLEDIEKDTHLKSQLATRRQKLIKKGWRIVAAEKNGKSTARSREIRDFVYDQLMDMKGSFEKDIEAMLDAVSKGFSITEKNFMYIRSGKWAGKTGLASLRFKPAKYFSFKYDKYGHYTLRQIDPDPSGVDLNLSKFIHLIAGNNDENPYGDGVTSSCAFWVWLKKNEAKFWAIYSERFGMPLTKITLPNNPTEADKTAADNLIDAIQTTSGIRVPKGFEADFMEAVRRGDVNYDNFIERCNKEISKVVLGATLTTEEGKRGQGSYALGQGHTAIMEDYIIFDAAMTSQAINEQLIRQLVDLNYSTTEYPRFEWLGVNIGSLISFSQSIGTLVDKGFKVPVSYVRNMTGIPEPEGDEEVLQPSGFGAAPVGLDNRANNFNQAPAYRIPLQERDDREKIIPLNEINVHFADVPDHIKEELAELDALHKRSVDLLGQKYEALIKKFSETAAKKKVPGSVTS